MNAPSLVATDSTRITEEYIYIYIYFVVTFISHRTEFFIPISARHLLIMLHLSS
jgi:hypothetical protein